MERENKKSLAISFKLLLLASVWLGASIIASFAQGMPFYLLLVKSMKFGVVAILSVIAFGMLNRKKWTIPLTIVYVIVGVLYSVIIAIGSDYSLRASIIKPFFSIAIYVMIYKAVEHELKEKDERRC